MLFLDFLRIHHNWSGKFKYVNKHSYDFLAKSSVVPGDVIIANVGDPGRVFIAPGLNQPMTLGPNAVLLKPYKGVKKKYLAYFFQSPWGQGLIQKIISGTAQKKFNKTGLRATNIPLCSEQLQYRIVAKIEELFSEIDKGIDNLNTAREQLKVYRQALLKQAFEGKLTEEWRKKHANQLETADQLLSRIKQERDKRYQEQLIEWEKALEQWESAGKEEKKPAKPRKPKKPIEISVKEIEQLSVLPSTWKWTSLGELVSGKKRAMQSGPFGSNLKHSEFTKEGILVIGIDNVHNGKFSMGSQNRISLEKFKELNKYQARSNDLLITVMASLGRTCVVPEDLEKAIITKHVYRISMEEELLFSSFYNLVLQSNTASRKRMFENAQGQTRPGLNSSILWEIPVPLCDIAEQKEIVSILESKLFELDRIEMTLEAETSKTDTIKQSILKKAFSGQLVSQDPSDEPASELLERIKIERQQAQKETRGLKAPRKKAKKKREKVMADLLEVLRSNKDWLSAQEAFRQCGIADGSETDDIEKVYEELRTCVKENKIAIERRGEEDWLRATQEG